ncbi:bifunctional folylpolyglutamate synthase/dihydrofolate synthase [bacterium]|nr:bifunctional folylpolyglutamate synthase/dihydrofolate synthase [bacterium]
MAIDSAFLESIYKKKQNEIKYDLNNITALADLFDNPEKELKIVHVTGTNGKGSTCAILESLMCARGLKTGLFTSPHLVNYNERFRINKAEIADKPLKRYLRTIVRRSKKAGIDPSFFEISAMAAFLYFRDQKVDWAILEVGLGGRLDATNIVIPELSLITMIDYDHRRLLGKSKTLIAKEKAAIIKSGRPFLTEEPSPRIRKVIMEEGKKRHGICPIEDKIQIEPDTMELGGSVVSITLKGQRYSRLAFSLGGSHQLANLHLALRADALLFGTPDENILRKGLSKVNWLGRLSVLSRVPYVVIDGCHNKSGALGLKETLRKKLNSVKGERVLLFGMVKKKPLYHVSQILFPLFDHVVVTGFDSVRARSVDSYIKYLEKYAKKYTIIRRPEAIMQSIHLKKGDMLMVTGSLYLLGDFLKEKIWLKLS